MDKRILGIDYGDKRTGIAVSDPTGLLAQGITTVTAGGDGKLISLLLPYIEQYDVGMIVLGDPINMDGSHGFRSEKAHAFAERLRSETRLEVAMMDERCTTMAASAYMNMTDTRGKKRKAVIDTASAQIILQNYLDRERAKRGV